MQCRAESHYNCTKATTYAFNIGEGRNITGSHGVVMNTGGEGALTKAGAETPPLLSVLGSLASSGKGLLAWEPGLGLFKRKPVIRHTHKYGSLRNPEWEGDSGRHSQRNH